MSDPLRHATVNEDGDFVCLALLYGADGAAVNQAAVSSIVLTVSPLKKTTNSDNETAWVLDADKTQTDYTGSSAPAVASTIYDSLQTDAIQWPNPPHTTGYNFRHVIPGAAIPDGATNYQADFTLTMADGTTMVVSFGVLTRKRYTDD